MDRNIQLLDCTLRDGGYVNDWEFGQDNLVSIFERLTDTGVDIVEVGFIDDRRPYDCNRSIFPDTESIGKLWKGIVKRPPMVVGMIDYGTCALENVQLCEDSFLDGIRVIFKKQKMHAAMEYCAELKRKGYKVFSQLVSITAYEEQDLKEIVVLVNKVKPFAVSMVDTYGLLDSSKLMFYYDYLDANIEHDINIGFHAHNNFQLAYSNARTFLDKETDRNILVDGTLFGMGKSAGNAPLELVSMYMNKKFGANYNIHPMLEAIEESIKPIYAQHPWGYKTFFYMSASNDCHPSYVDYLQRKENLSASKIDDILSQIEPNEKKLLYDENLIEELYQKYTKEDHSDADAYKNIGNELKKRKILLVGPGKNIKLQKDKVDRFIEKENPVIISINYIPEDIKVSHVFITKANRYKEMAAKLLEGKYKTIATSNIECRKGGFDYQFYREPLLEKKEQIKDNSFLMLLKILKLAGLKNVACAGLDGYSDREDNYVMPGMEYDFVKEMSAHLNYHIKDVIRREYGDMNIEFVTYSHYVAEDDIDSGTF
jgi:4-hydroxy 2-oxovalerate aldolase